MNPHPPADWFEFWVRFVCGALLGLVAGWYSLGPGLASWWALSLCCLVFGVVAGWFGDRFWHAIARSFWW